MLRGEAQRFAKDTPPCLASTSLIPPPLAPDATDGSCCSKLSGGGLPPWPDFEACLCTGDQALPGLSAFVNAEAVLLQCQPGSQSVASSQAMARSAVLSINGVGPVPMGTPAMPSAPPIDPPPVIVPASTPVAPPVLAEASAGGASARASTESSTAVMTRSVGSPPAEIAPAVLVAPELDGSVSAGTARSAGGSGAPGTSATPTPGPTPDTSVSSTAAGRDTLEAVSTATGSGSLGGATASTTEAAVDASGHAAAALGPSTGPTVLHDGGDAKGTSGGEQGTGGASSTAVLT
ncbi:hypothetical protein H632_c14p0 [Helicosporidium sp. ATCC 50920]|nr:hypothetical protein H632_c14p0 [Helicosporidium sp. ATCC 50920]|eukprot:KDD77119.1 hypothetical protein H632_c14p0 [Helicosporidium sp. ATCC 50920]